jgi:hypothetical protein
MPRETAAASVAELSQSDGAAERSTARKCAKLELSRLKRIMPILHPVFRAATVRKRLWQCFVPDNFNGRISWANSVNAVPATNVLRGIGQQHRVAREISGY